jgi:hypothetical protein
MSRDRQAEGKGWYGDFQTIAARSDDCTT